MPGGRFAQFSANIDLDDEFAPPPLGGGAPSSSFGAAAGDQGKGVWNKIDAAGQEPTELLDLNGNLSGVILSGPTWGGSSGFNYAGNQGDTALLENDGRQVEHDVWTFTGLSSGRYKIYTYSAWPNDFMTETAVTVPGADIETLIVTGPMPGGNKLIEGVTHSVHFLTLTTNTFSIQIDRGAAHWAFVNGFQVISLVPEPMTLATMSTAFFLLSLRKRKRRS